MIKNKVHAFLASAVALAALFVSCDQNSGVIPSAPALTDFRTPGLVTLSFSKGSKLPLMTYNIDNINKLIYNGTPYPYQTKLDSAYLRMNISSESDVKITNELTKKTVNWSLRDTGKIDVSGGKLLIEVSRRNFDPIVYKLRLQIYGYNPDKLTWKKSESALPTPSEDGHVFVHAGDKYWLSRNERKIELYRISDIDKGEFVRMRGVFPDGLRPKTLVTDRKNVAWVLDDEGNVYYSESLAVWTKVDTQSIRITGLLYDISTSDDKATVISAIGHTADKPDDYYTYSISQNNIERKTKLDATMPVRNSYIYLYETAGQTNANIIGGVDKEGKAVRANHFTSDGFKWGEMPYTGKGFSTPMEGALFMRHGNSIYIVGGKYDKIGIQNKMYKSPDRGLSWVELNKQQEPGQEFTPRTGVSGLLEGTEADPKFYLFGGIVGGRASREFWKGFLDTTGGIINSIKE
ncbi:DUF6242 domain-containing protein [Porphyromonas sp.]|uniref:DUF6242 domain-containing protein n=1 Tax=Porphyromonas sp. TaxID=1924944 RepID=UPI0026DC48F6|nr:DUF6242 domain-containing protein [Porphyromonas sp.]MDO4770938.1 DUF6242 domain-containing protein [Porphyromonas sp.]